MVFRPGPGRANGNSAEFIGQRTRLSPSSGVTARRQHPQ